SELVALGRAVETAQHGQRVGAAPSDEVGGGMSQAAVSIDAFLEATSELDIGVLDRVLDATFASQRFEPAMHDVVFP
ncbi:hypothetical protein, partial [Salmonella sp. SAL4436]|uniref:hypothetical protein n=1 Tax=Salmonella sp. SAL4436 TaxID=3159891 RepID=UPI00397B4680